MNEPVIASSMSASTILVFVLTSIRIIFSTEVIIPIYVDEEYQV